MKIYTKAGDLAFYTFTFPDGQPHFTLETYEREFDSVTVEVAIKDSRNLLETALVGAVLRQAGYSEVNLDIRYLMGARMDRPISMGEPNTLAVIARIINGAGFSRVRILDVHSEVATRLIRNSVNVLPTQVVRSVSATLGGDFYVCAPDTGSVPRVSNMVGFPKVLGSKVRDMATGKLSDFKVHGDCVGQNILIIDDICDGGGTFMGLAEALKKAGANKIYLYITHGIFSKGTGYMHPLIEHIYTTDSYRDPNDTVWQSNVTVIPVSMKEMK